MTFLRCHRTHEFHVRDDLFAGTLHFSLKFQKTIRIFCLKKQADLCLAILGDYNFFSSLIIALTLALSRQGEGKGQREESRGCLLWIVKVKRKP